MTDRIPAASFKGWIEAEHIVLDDREAFARQIKRLEGERVSLTLKKFRKGRSRDANAYYWGVVVEAIAEFTGYLPQEAHDALKQRFLTDHTDCPLPRVRSTATLDSREFGVYVDRCIQFAAECGIIIPEPE